ncbi:MAG: S8 family peptidase [Flavobacteriales bacterium]|nr:S8 family peptidase [Flavobacteriales bacterium]
MKKLFPLATLAFSIVSTTHLRAQGPEHIAGDVLVMLAPGTAPEQLSLDLRTLDGVGTGLGVAWQVSAPMRAWLLRFDAAVVDEQKLLNAVRRHPAVQMAQFNHIVHERIVPNDAQYAQVWHHQNIDSEAAWDISTGGVTATGDTIVVAIMENADVSHADLNANRWINYDEIPGNGVDDDANGYIDDVRGWNTPSNNDNVYSGSHGTQCAGMAGAVGNNALGVVGANWNVKLMPVNYGGVGEAQVVAAYTYPLVMRRLYNSTNGQKGAFVVATSASWGIDGGQPEDSPLWCAIYDTLGTAGVLNCGATANNAVNVDVVGDLPTACASDFMISVTATNNVDQRTFSAWGLTTIDLGAPGDNVRTTSIGGGYGNTSGTSFACPLTAGVIGLLYSAPCATMMALVHADPQEGALYVRQKLFEGVEQVGNLPNNTVTGGRVSSGNSMELIMAGCGTCPSPFALNAVHAGADANFSWSSTGTGPFNLRYRAVGSPNWIEVLGLAATNATVNGIDPCIAYEFQVQVICDTETSDYSASSYLNPPAEGAPTITASGYEVICPGAAFTLTASTATGNVWSTNETTQSINPQASGSYSVTFNGLCGTYTSAAFDVTVLPAPTAPTASDVQLPGPGVATLNATGANISWYATQSGGTAVGTGNSWDTPFLWSTTSYWCSSAASNDPVSVYGALTNRINTATPGQYHTNGDNWEVFTANQAFTIRSVKVYASGAAIRPIGVVNAAGATIVQGNFNIPDGESRVDVNFTVPGPGTYGLKIMSGNPQLWRDGNGSNPAYPFALGSFGSITSSTVAGANAIEYYYFFYDWEVSEIEVLCESERVEVVVDMPAAVGSVAGGSALSVFPSPADRDMFFDLTGSGASGRALITVLDHTGREVMWKSMDNGRATLTTAFLADGLYVYRITTDGREIATGRFAVEHL